MAKIKLETFFYNTVLYTLLKSYENSFVKCT